MNQSKIIALSQNGVIDRSKTAYERRIFGDMADNELPQYLSSINPVYREALSKGYKLVAIDPEEWNKLNQPDPTELEKQKAISSRRQLLNSLITDMIIELDQRIDNPKITTPIKDKYKKIQNEISAIESFKTIEQLDEFLNKPHAPVSPIKS